METERDDKKNRPSFRFLATGIGSVPYLDIAETCDKILGSFSQIPFWPQFVKRSPFEDMGIQFSEAMPLLEYDEQRQSVALSSLDRESALVSFYEHLLAEDASYFSVSPAYAPGLYHTIQAVQTGGEKFGPYIKGHTVGPFTFSAGIINNDGKSVLYDFEMMEALSKGLAIKALWQAGELAKTGKRPILFFDEPYLSGFGSAFSPIQRHDVVHILKECFDYLRERINLLIGIHCCGNTDWSMIMEAGPDIINFDASGYLDHFLLYPEDLIHFLQNGGYIAWGIIPTLHFTGEESVEGLYERLCIGLDRLREWGLDQEFVAKRSLLTPACGMGTMDPSSADHAMLLLSQLSEKMR